MTSSSLRNRFLNKYGSWKNIIYWGNELLRANRTLRCPENTHSVFPLLWKRPDWPQPGLRRVARQVPGRRHRGRVGLVWQTAQGHSSLNPQSRGRYAGAQLRYSSKSEAEGRTPRRAWLKSGKMKAWKFITSTEQITSGGKWDRREFLSIRWLIRSLLHQTYPFCALVTEGLHASERHAVLGLHRPGGWRANEGTGSMSVIRKRCEHICEFQFCVGF